MGNPETEMLDVIDPATGEILGQRTRADVHREGLWHQVFHCLIVRPATGAVILQERSMEKLAFPGKLDLSATGHLEAGELPIDGLRELHEELGVAVDPDEVFSAGTRLLADHSGEGKRNHELVHVFFHRDERPLEDYSPAPDEVSGLVEVIVDDLLDLLADRSLEVPCQRWALSSGTTLSTMRRTDLVVDTDGYWSVLAVMAQRYLAGDLPLAV